MAFEDLTARARIREAALAQFAEHGFERTTIRGIARAAGVSPGLLRHHFGSKQELKDAVDAHVMAEIRRANAEVMERSFGASMITRESMRPYQSYLSRSLVDGSTTFATLFDQIVDLTEGWIAMSDEAYPDEPPFSDRRSRAAALTAMALGVPILREHLSRAIGVDIFSDEGDRRLTDAMLDLYSRALVSREFAEAARAAFDTPTPSQPTRSSS
jgi:AcrR family transcriptional regulator